MPEASPLSAINHSRSGRRDCKRGCKRAMFMTKALRQGSPPKPWSLVIIPSPWRPEPFTARTSCSRWNLSPRTSICFHCNRLARTLVRFLFHVALNDYRAGLGR